MSATMLANSALLAACGENATCARMPVSLRSFHCAEPVLPKPAASSFAQKASNAAANGATAVLPVSTSALLFWTKNPRQEKLVEPHTTACTFGPSTTIVLL